MDPLESPSPSRFVIAASHPMACSSRHPVTRHDLFKSRRRTHHRETPIEVRDENVSHSPSAQHLPPPQRRRTSPFRVSHGLPSSPRFWTAQGFRRCGPHLRHALRLLLPKTLPPSQALADRSDASQAQRFSLHGPCVRLAMLRSTAQRNPSSATFGPQRLRLSPS